MIQNYTSAKEGTSDPSISSWLAKLQEGKKSTLQLQTDMLKSTSDTIKDLQKKAAEKLKEAAKEKSDTNTAENTEVTASTDEIKAPSEVTAEDLESPIDIKV